MLRPSSPIRRSRRLLAVAGVAVLVLAACGGDDDDDSETTDAPTATEAPAATEAAGTTEAPGTTAAAGGEATVAVADSSLGEILVDSAGMTLYMFTPDAQGPSTCTGGCLEAWPALAGPVTAGDGVSGELGTATRPDDSSEQATCNGWPLYTFTQDSAPGDVTGQGSGDKWYVLDATCTPVGMEDAGATATTAAAAGAGDPYGGGGAATGATVAMADSSLGPIVVDGDGMTLYMFTPDAQGPSTCTGGCLEAWPMVHGPVTAGAGVTGALGTAPRPEDGTPQATCNGWPLYTFTQDSAPGDVTGQGSGDKWYVLDATCTPVGMG